MPLSDWTERQFLALTAGIVGGILLIMAGVLFYVYSTYDGLVKEIESVSQQVAGLEKEAKRLGDMKQKLEDETAQKHFVDARVPEDANIEELIQQINDQSRSAGLNITSMQEGATPGGRKPAKAERYEPVRMNLECSGGFHELGLFLNRIEERMERLVAVGGLSIKAHKDGLEPGAKNLKISVQLVTYKFNNPNKKKQ